MVMMNDEGFFGFDGVKIHPKMLYYYISCKVFEHNQ